MNSTEKKLIIAGFIGTFILLSYNWIIGFNNYAIELRENNKTAWGNVESAYQRRNDLIGNLVNTVKGAADFEKSTLTAVIEARAKATSITIDPSKITAEQLSKFQESQSGLNSALSRLMLTVEKYPDLRANENFLKLQIELEGTENRIKIARDRYNREVNPYNVHILSFPNSILAKKFNFEPYQYYKSDYGAENAVEVKL